MRRAGVTGWLLAGGAVLAALVTARVGAQAPPVLAPAPPPAPGSAGQPALGVRFTLANGLVVLVAERPGLPIVSVRVSVPAGAVLDPPDKAGLASFTASLLTRGTRSRSGPEIDRAIEFVGGSLEAEGGRDAAGLTLAVLRRDLGLGLDLLAEVLQAPTFPADELERVRDETLAGLRRSEEDPGTVAVRLLRRLLFGGHPYAEPVDGTEASVGRLTRDDVVGFHASAYRPEGTIVAVAGDVTVADVRRELETRLGSWRPAGPAPAAPGPAPLGAPPRAETVQRDLNQATIILGQATVNRAHPDYHALVVASQVLGGGSSSRLYARVREERGLAYAISAQYLPGRHGGLFLVDAQTENARVREVLTLVREELVRLLRERVPDEELARAKGYLVGSFPLRLGTNGEVAALLVGIEQHGLGLDYPARYRRAIEAVTADDVQRAVRAHWDPDRMSLAVVANLREAGLGSP